MGFDPTQIARRQSVGIIGSGKVGPDSEAYRVARDIAAGLAARGLVIVCGGRGGVMEAACRGACDAGGLSIGILPGPDLAEGNRFATLHLPTGLGTAQAPIVAGPPRISRNRVIASAASCLVAVAGSVGTADEIDHALSFGKTVYGICDAPLPGAIGPEFRYRAEDWGELVQAVLESLGMY